MIARAAARESMRVPGRHRPGLIGAACHLLPHRIPDDLAVFADPRTVEGGGEQRAVAAMPLARGKDQRGGADQRLDRVRPRRFDRIDRCAEYLACARGGAGEQGRPEAGKADEERIARARPAPAEVAVEVDARRQGV